MRLAALALSMLPLLAGAEGAAGADAAPGADLAAWRAEVARVRVLAGNDTEAAQVAAERLRATLPAEAGDADRAGVLNLLARIALHRAENPLGAELATEARALAERAGDRAGQVEADLALTYIYTNLARIDDARSATTRAITLVDGLDGRPELVAEAMLLTAGMHQRDGRLEELVATSMQAMEMARRSGSPLALAYAHKAVAISLGQTNHLAEAKVHFQAALEAARVAHYGLLEADALMGLSWSAKDAGDLPEAVRLASESLALYRRIGAPFNVTLGLFALADVYHAAGRDAEALPLLDELVATYTRVENKLAEWWGLNLRATVLRGLRRTAASEADLRRAYALARETDYPFHRAESARLLAALSAERGDHRRAYAYLLESSEMSARFARERASTRIIELTRRYESESKQRQLDALAQREQQQAMKLRQRELQQRWLFTILGACAVALALTAHFLVRLRRSHALLALANAELQRSQDVLERRVKERTAALEGVNRELEAFAYSVSHDLRAPVRHIDGFAGLLARRADGALDAQGHHYLQNIAAAAKRMGALIDDLLAFSRTSRSELKREAVDLGALVLEAVRDLEAEARGRAVEWRLGALPTVVGSRSLLRIVLVNLLSNALKYTKPRAHAIVEVGVAPGDAGGAVVFVRDNGVGFDMKYAGKLFGVFQRLHQVDEFEGTGIGLATVRRIVDRHGGRTWAEGRPGEGATFYFALPAEPPEEHRPPAAAPAARAG